MFWPNLQLLWASCVANWSRVKTLWAWSPTVSFMTCSFVHTPVKMLRNMFFVNYHQNLMISWSPVVSLGVFAWNCCDAVGILVLSSIHSFKNALLSASLWIWATTFVPCVSSVAVLELFIVDPSPIGIQDQLVVLGAAATAAALCHCNRGTAFRLLPWLLRPAPSDEDQN